MSDFILCKMFRLPRAVTCFIRVEKEVYFVSCLKEIINVSD